MIFSLNILTKDKNRNSLFVKKDINLMVDEGFKKEEIENWHIRCFKI